MSDRSEAADQHAVRGATPAYRAVPAKATQHEMSPGYKRTEVGVIPEDWECAPLGAVANLLTGFPFPSSGFSHDGTLLVRGSNVKRGELDWNEEITRYWRAVTPELSRYQLQEGDLVIAMDGALVGRSFAVISRSDLPALLVQRVARIRSDQVNQQLMVQWMAADAFANYVDSVKTHTAIPHISPGDIRAFFVAIPKSPEEQRAIATALSDADALIESLDRLIAKKRDIKQAAMQQLLTGQTRLPGFTSEWKTKRLGEIADLYQPVTISAANFTEAGYPVYGANGLIGFYEKFNHKTWQVIVTCRGSTCGTVNKTIEKSWITGNAMVVNCDGKGDIDKLFLYYQMLNQDLTACISGTGQPQIVRRPLAEYQIRLPSDSSEQRAIATILSDMDAEIERLERRHDKAREIKQSMMQQLLTGRVRLVQPEDAAWRAVEPTQPSSEVFRSKSARASAHRSEV